MSNGEDHRSVFYKVVNDVSEDDWREFMRKLGYPEIDLHRMRARSRYDMLLSWNQKAGHFCEKVRKIVSGVMKEVRLGKRDLAVDECFTDDDASPLLQLFPARDTAWFQYMFVELHSDMDAFWNDVVLSPRKFNLRDFEVSRIRENNRDDVKEAMFQAVLLFRQREALKTVKEMVIKMNEWNLTLPDGYTERETASTRENSQCLPRSLR